MEEEVEKEKVLGVFMEARIVPCCDGSFMNECIMYYLKKKKDAILNSYRKLLQEAQVSSSSVLKESAHVFLITSKVHLSNSTPLSMFEMLSSS